MEKSIQKCDLPIKTRKECEEAAAFLGLSDQEAKDDTSGVWEDLKPKFCYLNKAHDEKNQLLFNKDGTNTGMCWYDRPCLCKGINSMKEMILSEEIVPGLIDLYYVLLTHNMNGIRLTQYVLFCIS